MSKLTTARAKARHMDLNTTVEELTRCIKELQTQYRWRLLEFWSSNPVSQAIMDNTLPLAATCTCYQGGSWCSYKCSTSSLGKHELLSSSYGVF